MPNQTGEIEMSTPEPMLHEAIRFAVNLIVLTIVFYFAGLIVVGKKRALLGDAITIALLGTVINAFFLLLLPRAMMLGTILSLIAWLLLIRHYYETGWLGALAVAILAVIIFVTLGFILSLLLMLPFMLLPW